MAEPAYEFILYETEDRIARIRLNRPEKRNALNLGIRGEIVGALRRAERDDTVSRPAGMSDAAPARQAPLSVVPALPAGTRPPDPLARPW